MNVADSRRQVYQSTNQPKTTRREVSLTNLPSLKQLASSEQILSPSQLNLSHQQDNEPDDTQRLVKQFYQDFPKVQTQKDPFNDYEFEDVPFPSERRSRMATLLQNNAESELKQERKEVKSIHEVNSTNIDLNLSNFQHLSNLLYEGRTNSIDVKISTISDHFANIYKELVGFEQDSELLRETLLRNLPITKNNYLKFFNKVETIQCNLNDIIELEGKLNKLKEKINEDKLKIKEMNEIIDKIENIQMNLKRSKQKRNEFISYLVVALCGILVMVWCY